MQIIHKNLGLCYIDEGCVHLNKTNPDPTSTFVVQDKVMKEVTTGMLRPDSLTIEPLSPPPWRLEGPFDNVGSEEDPTGSTWFDLFSAAGSVAHLNLSARPDGQHLSQVRNDGLLMAKAPDYLLALKKIAARIDPNSYDSPTINFIREVVNKALYS